MLVHTLHPAHSYPEPLAYFQPCTHCMQFVLFLAPQAVTKPVLALLGSHPQRLFKVNILFHICQKGKTFGRGRKVQKDCMDFS